MAQTHLRITGTHGAVRALEQLRNGSGQLTRLGVRVEADTPYAYGIEYGRHRGGRLARRAGPARYLRGALDAVRPEMARRIVDKLTDGGTAVRAELRAIERDLQREARSRVPIVSGRLRDSIGPGRGSL